MKLLGLRFMKLLVSSVSLKCGQLPQYQEANNYVKLYFKPTQHPISDPIIFLSPFSSEKLHIKDHTTCYRSHIQMLGITLVVNEIYIAPCCRRLHHMHMEYSLTSITVCRLFVIFPLPTKNPNV